VRHRSGNKKLSRAADQRIAMLRSIVQSLFTYGAIKTTEARAKQAKKIAEKLITTAKTDTLASRRQVESFIRNNAVLKSIFSAAKEKYIDRPGGYTRLTKVGFRRGDNCPVVMLELI